MGNRCLMILLGLALLAGGCISASSSTGSDSQASVKTNQKTSQETASTDSVKVCVEKTVIDRLDKNGRVIERLTIGGGSAETGSSSLQQSDTSAKVDALAKSQAEASAKSAFNMTIVFICLGLLIIASVVTRIIAAINKLKKPI